MLYHALDEQIERGKCIVGHFYGYSASCMNPFHKCLGFVDGGKSFAWEKHHLFGGVGVVTNWVITVS